MWAYVARRLLYNIPVFLSIILFMMLALRVNDPVYAHLGKSETPESIEAKRVELGMDRPFLVQYADFLLSAGGFLGDDRSWENEQPVSTLLAKSIPPSMAITVPALCTTAAISIVIGLFSSFYRGRWPDRLLVFVAVIGMSVSFLVYIILGQYFGAYWLTDKLGHEIFAVSVDAGVGDVGWGYFNPRYWIPYCALPVMINVIVAMGYDTRFYRSVMVEECNRDYITTAVAKGAKQRTVMFVHMLKNAMIPIITRIMITLPFLITGSILLEIYFNIPGMGRTLINAIRAKDFPVVQSFTALFAFVFIITNILTDVLYAVVDPRVRLQ